MNKLLLITILLIIFTGCHENQQWMSKEKSTARKSVLEMTTGPIRQVLQYSPKFCPKGPK